MTASRVEEEARNYHVRPAQSLCRRANEALEKVHLGFLLLLQVARVETSGAITYGSRIHLIPS